MPPTRENLMHFVSHVKSLTKKDDDGLDGFDSEYKTISAVQVTIKQSIPAEVGRRAENLRKNRYKDIVPYDPERVVLPEVYNENGAVAGSDYINASFIQDFSGGRGYIAAMGPMSTTVNDFWRMLWNYDVQTVVMLCNEMENGRKKCASYIVNKEKPQVRHGEFKIEFMDECIHNESIVSTVVMFTRGEECKVLRHFHFRTWPDHGVPTSSEPIVELIQMIRDHQPRNDPPIVVHCSAGCGRTGTVIAVDYAWQLLENGRDTNFYLPDIVLQMRRHRVSLVQTKEQYVLIYRSVLKLAKLYMRKKKKNDEMPAPPKEEDLYGNFGVQGMDYGQQVLALQPKKEHAPLMPCFTVRVDDRGDAEEADLMDKLNLAASSSAQVYETEADLQAVEDDDGDEKPPELPCRTAQSTVMEDSAYQAPSMILHRTKRSTTTEDTDEPPPILPARTEDSYHLAENTPDMMRRNKNVMSPDAEFSPSPSRASGPDMSDYSAINDLRKEDPGSLPPARSPNASRRGSVIKQVHDLGKSAGNGPQLPSSSRPKSIVRPGTNSHSSSPRPTSPIPSPMEQPRQKPQDRRDANKLGLKRVGRPKGPRPPPSNWRTVMT